MQASATIYESGDYLENNPDWHAADAPFKARWAKTILGRNGVDPKHIVEIGCGSGEILCELSSAFPQARLEGYDISPQAMEIAQPKARDGLAFHLEDYLTADTPAADLIMAFDVFEHVEDYMGFLRKLRTKGQFKLFHIPLDMSVQGVLRSQPIMRVREIVGHLHYFDKETALATLRDCGYEIVDWNYTYHASLLNRRLAARVMDAPRKVLRAVNEDFAVRLLGGASMMVLTR
jgi:cyclopropane fatty-acyl-phospholipid synthase-like methyltransferase